MEPTIQIANINAMLQVSHDELGELLPSERHRLECVICLRKETEEEFGNHNR